MQSTFKMGIPSCDLKVCRICFATDCNLYSIRNYKNLDQAYEILTGLLIQNNDKLPSYLCTECGYCLLKFFQFRSKSIKANSILENIIQKQANLTLEAIKTNEGYQQLRSKLGISQQHTNHYDLKIEHIERENKYTDEQRHVQGTPNLYTVNVIKIERDDRLSEDIPNDEASPYDAIYQPRLHEVTLPGIKLEKDLYCESSPKHEVPVNYNKDTANFHDTMGIKVKVETVVMTNQDCVDENYTTNDAHHLPHGEDGSLDDGLSLGEQELHVKVTRKVIKEIKDPKYLTKTTSDQHSKHLSESNDMSTIDYTLSSSTSSYQIHKEMKSLKSLYHLRKKYDNKQKYLCDICNKYFSRNHKLQLHLRIHSGEKPYSCEMCDSAFITKHMLGIHMRIHSGEKPYSCDVCKKSFKKKGNLSKHSRVHSGEKPFLCATCWKSFSQKGNLNKHVKIHSDEKPYWCKLCQKSFNQIWHLENHIRTHTGEKPYSCNICDKLFTIKCNPDKHLKLHSGEKRFYCEICYEGFNENNRFQTHMRVHLGEKPFKCDVCKKAFSAISCLQSHLKIHSDEKPYICYNCKKAFRHRNHLISHLRTHS